MPEVTIPKKLGFRRGVRGFVLLFLAAFQADPGRATLNFVVSLAQPVAGIYQALLSKRIVDQLLAHDGPALQRTVIFMGLAVAVSVGTGWGGFNLNMTLREKVGELMDRRIMELTLAVPSLEHHERAEYLDEIEILRTQRDQLSSSVQAVVMNLSVYVQMGGTIGLLGGIDPVLMLLPLFGVPSLWAAGAAEKRRQATMDKVAEPMRVTRHLLETATTAGPAKELRLFGLGPVLVGRHKKLWHEIDAIQDRTAIQAAGLSAMGWIIFGIGFVGALWIVAERAINGHGSPGDVFLALTLASQVNGQLGGVVGLVTWLISGLRTVGRYLWLVDYAAVANAPIADEVPAPSNIARGIDFDDVTFRYPGTQVDVLRDVSLHIPAGATVAIVGDNGAGKSTLVKLLCRFYDPMSGTIRVDDTDLRRINPIAWRDKLSAGFQDFARFELIARETVGVGRLSSIDDEAEVRAALGRASGDGVVDALPDGFETQLGKSFAGGAELSGGQWQKLALGRAMMREDPVLLVLDEPTAALDAQTEHALFERYAGAARRNAASNGAITVLVSHRFSTVRMADLIVVVDGSSVAEVGSHAELVAAGGLYAELFELQARAYR